MSLPFIKKEKGRRENARRLSLHDICISAQYLKDTYVSKKIFIIIFVLKRYITHIYNLQDTDKYLLLRK